MNYKKIKLNKKSILLIILLVILSMYFVFNISWLPRLKSYGHINFIINLNNDKARVGASDNVFIAKVIGKKETNKKESIMGIETVYEVEIIKNIKGNLEGKTIVTQTGGISGFLKYEVHGIESLNEGAVYIFETMSQEHDIRETPKSQFLLTDKEMSKKELMKFINNNERVKEIEDAYEYEVYVDSDLINNTLINPRAELTKKERIERLRENREREKKWWIENTKFKYKYNKGIILTDEEIKRILDLRYLDDEIMVFDSPEQAFEWDLNNLDNERKKYYKEIEEKKKIEKDILKRVEEEKKNGKYKDPRKGISKEEKEKEKEMIMMMK